MTKDVQFLLYSTVCATLSYYFRYEIQGVLMAFCSGGFIGMALMHFIRPYDYDDRDK